MKIIHQSSLPGAKRSRGDDSLEDYEALQETAYLLRAPKNARRLLESVAELEQGGVRRRSSLDEAAFLRNA
ncbi:type II toxin-antitoxin system Phd/YefM family antitoxin [Halomonas sp. WWR20]